MDIGDWGSRRRLIGDWRLVGRLEIGVWAPGFSIRGAESRTAGAWALHWAQADIVPSFPFYDMRDDASEARERVDEVDAVVCAQLVDMPGARLGRRLARYIGFWAGEASPFSCCTSAATSGEGPVDGVCAFVAIYNPGRAFGGRPSSGSRNRRARATLLVGLAVLERARGWRDGVRPPWCVSPGTSAETRTSRGRAAFCRAFRASVQHAIDSGLDCSPRLSPSVSLLSSPLRAASTHAIQSEMIEGLAHDVVHHGVRPADEID